MQMITSMRRHDWLFLERLNWLLPAELKTGASMEERFRTMRRNVVALLVLLVPSARKLAEYSGQFRLRVPRSVHEELARRAQMEGVSLNTLAVAYISEGLGRTQAPLRAVREGSRRHRKG